MPAPVLGRDTAPLPLERLRGTGMCWPRAEALHRRGDAAVQRVPNSLAQTQGWFVPMNNPLGPSGPDGFP